MPFSKIIMLAVLAFAAVTISGCVSYSSNGEVDTWVTTRRDEHTLAIAPASAKGYVGFAYTTFITVEPGWVTGCADSAEVSWTFDGKDSVIKLTRCPAKEMYGAPFKKEVFHVDAQNGKNFPKFIQEQIAKVKASDRA